MNVKVLYPNAPKKEDRVALAQGVIPESLGYYTVWEGFVEGPSALDEVCRAFSSRHRPARCRGMHPGDIVALEDSFYFYDAVGFKPTGAPTIEVARHYGW